MAAPAKRERKKSNRLARLAAAEETRRKAARRRQFLTFGGLIVAVVAVLVVMNLVGGDDDETDVTAGATSTTTAAVTDTTTATAMESAAGKPCVALSEPLPPGNPEVPVDVGPPPTALVTRDITVGDGPEVAPGATVNANYVGVSCSTGKIFDSSFTRGSPTEFSLNEVIKGWTDGIPGMKVGGRRLLGIPSDQAYGPAGRPGIAPDEALWFVVEIVGVS